MTDTIPDLKRAFLRAQVQVLSSPLEPTEDWRRRSAVPENGDLPEKVVDVVLAKVNTLVRQHNASAFPAPALAHVAAQIDALYWADSEPSLDAANLTLQNGEISRATDLTCDKAIALLPPTWPTDSPAPTPQSKRNRPSRTSNLETFAEGARYSQLHTKLSSLAAKRAQAAAKLAQMRALAEMLAPLEDPGENVQGNLVHGGRDGELVRELERMMVLVQRMGGKVEALNAGGDGGGG